MKKQTKEQILRQLGYICALPMLLLIFWLVAKYPFIQNSWWGIPIIVSIVVLGAFLIIPIYYILDWILDKFVS